MSETSSTSIDDLIEDFQFLDDWEDRYRYIIELGKSLSPLADDEKNAATKVKGCVSQVWLVAEKSDTSSQLRFRGESDALIVQGLIAVLLKMFDGKSPAEILNTDATGVFATLGLDEHLTPQRSNGLAAMVQRIRADAQAAQI